MLLILACSDKGDIISGPSLLRYYYVLFYSNFRKYDLLHVVWDKILLVYHSFLNGSVSIAGAIQSYWLQQALDMNFCNVVTLKDKARSKYCDWDLAASLKCIRSICNGRWKEAKYFLTGTFILNGVSQAKESYFSIYILILACTFLKVIRDLL